MTTSNPFHSWTDLSHPRLGSEVICATDDFFAPMHRLIDPRPPVWVPDKYDENGKWMDGWESRRKRTPGHDYCIVKLGQPGLIRGINIDTSHFTGNYPPAAAIEVCHSATPPNEDTEWQPLLERTNLEGNSQLYREIHHSEIVTYLKLNIYPDGGIARLRIYGEIQADFTSVTSDELLDYFAIENGGRALHCNDEHFGSMHNLNAPGRADSMADGWETRRRREPGNDWVIVKLGHPAEIEQVIIDTAYFKGNFPDRASLQACLTHENDPQVLAQQSDSWPLLLDESKLAADTIHTFDKINHNGTISHLRMNIYPDGGISRLRLFGRITR